MGLPGFHLIAIRFLGRENTAVCGWRGIGSFMGETGPQNDRFSAQHLGHGRNVGSAALPKARYFPRSTECPLLAISRHSEGSSRTSALPPKADIRGARTVAIQKADIGCLQLCIVFIGPAETRLDLTTVCRVNLPWRIADITLGTIAFGTRQTVQVFQHLLNCWRIPHLVIEL